MRVRLRDTSDSALRATELFPSLQERKSFSITEVAALFGLTVQGIHLWIRKGRVREFTRTSRKGKFRIPRGEVVRILRQEDREAPGLWTRGGERTRLLLIDDDALIRRMVTDAFKKPGLGVDARTAATVEDGLLEAGRMEPDVIVLDYFFKRDRLQGDAALAFIRKAKALRKVKVIGVCSKARLGPRMLKAGADSFLLKPFSVAELRERVFRLAPRD